MRARFVNEKFQDESDPINDLEIGIKGIVYRCDVCGGLIDEYGEVLFGDKLNRAQIILDKFGDKYVKETWCNVCQEEEYNREQDRARQEEYERERQEEGEQRWREENELRW